MAETQALALFTETTQALQVAGDMAAIVADNFVDGGGIAYKDLTRFKSGAGGSVLFTKISTDPETGKPVEDAVRSIDAIVIARRAQRAYWASAMGTGDKKPDCRSLDGLVGEGDNGTGKGRHDCARCALNQFGSKVAADGKQGAGKACRETRIYFMVVNGTKEIFPAVLTIPPASLGNLQRYAAALTNQMKSFSNQVHRFELEKVKSQGGVDFAQVRVSKIREMQPVEIEKTKEYAAAIHPLLARFYEQAVDEAPEQESDPASAGATAANTETPIGAETETVTKPEAPSATAATTAPVTEIEPDFEIVQEKPKAQESQPAQRSTRGAKKGDQTEMFAEPTGAHRDPA